MKGQRLGKVRRRQHRSTGTAQRGFSEPEGGTSPAEEGAWYRGAEEGREGKGTHWEGTVGSTVVTTQCAVLESKCSEEAMCPTWAQGQQSLVLYKEIKQVRHRQWEPAHCHKRESQI